MGVGKSGDDHLRAWADVHHTQPPEGFVAGWLRAAAAVARPLARAGVSADAVTVAALLAAVASVPLAAIDGWAGPAAACLAVTVSGLLDSLDGAVAVQAGRTTRVGFLLDSTLDRLADAALPASLAIVAGDAAQVAVAAAAAAWWLEYIRARASLAAGLPNAMPAACPNAVKGAPERQVITPGERPTRIVLTAVGLGLPPLALAALWAQVVIVGGSALFLLAHSVRRLRRLDAGPPAPTA